MMQVFKNEDPLSEISIMRGISHSLNVIPEERKGGNKKCQSRK
jgi:hypothetical protein